MSPQYFVDAILVIGLIVFLGRRQLTWRPVDISQMWRLPIILGVVGLAILGTTDGRFSALDVTLIAVELVTSLAIGAWMGAAAHFRRLPEPVRLGRDDRYLALYESRTAPWGLALWGLMIAARVGLAVIAHVSGAQLAASTGIILLAFAANRAGNTFVFAGRLTRHAAAPMTPYRDALRS
ncbi:hypothetical protein GOEFS_019_00040 [Gordonia effusa NBRC 100432]|uniref:DUF1453 domain-containing protein n=1 Tax=Gordonia effusa NBRC 100432 TaxID=1077974 RepID=H0QW90_9ACTN|nr:hypothetical protein [Gordonia effusa]GAB17091.1 hypothetical protein GOEFS_019_00040 [Gordonia effusa NBRC 100432]